MTAQTSTSIVWARGRQNTLLTSLQEIIPDGLLVVDEHRRIVAWNRRFLDLWGVPEALVAKGNDDPVLRHVLAQTADPQGFYGEVERLYRHLEENEVGTEIRLQDGRCLERYSKGLIDESGACWGRIWFFRDITERKQVERELRESEARFRQLTEHMLNTALWITSTDGLALLYSSPACAAITGVACEDLTAGWPASWLNLIHSDDRPRVRSVLADPVRFQQEGEETYRLVRPDGAIRWIRVSRFPLRAESGEVYRVAGMTEDVTERREAQDRLWRQQAELSHLARLQVASEMAAGLAHELNQPLAAIATHLHACRHRVEMGTGNAASQITSLEKALQQSLRAGDIVRRLRGFIRKSEPQLAPVDVNALIREVVAFLEVETRQQAVHLIQDLAEGLPPTCADGIQIQQVLVNLIHNALEALAETATESERHVHIRTRWMDSATVEVVVRDNGPGLPDSVRERLFQPFITTKAQGTGLGLWISRSIIEVHDGRLTAENRPEGGAEFRFTLPAEMPH